MGEVVILRGLPGSGKSTLAKSFMGALVLSTDDWFLVGSKYCFDASKLSEAHAWNLWRFKQALSNGVSFIVVDNTNILLEHMKPYRDAATEGKYNVTVMIVKTSLSDEELAARTLHGVPVEAITRMRKCFEDGV